MKFLVSYAVNGQAYGCEYANYDEANENFLDICGYEHVTDCKLTKLDSKDPPNRGPFKIEEPQSRFDREDPV